MEKLKTLKEIERDWADNDVQALRCSVSLAYKLKQEAIKHYKAEKKAEEICGDRACLYLMGWLEKFFNITPEDLK